VIIHLNTMIKSHTGFHATTGLLNMHIKLANEWAFHGTHYRRIPTYIINLKMYRTQIQK